LVACSKNERAFITALAEFEATKHHDFNGESCFVPSAVFVVWPAPRAGRLLLQREQEMFPDPQSLFAMPALVKGHALF
jgi:hypothetical protein